VNVDSESGVTDDLKRKLAALGKDAGITSLEPLDGGLIASVWRVEYADGSIAVAKTLRDAAPDTFALEAEGLAALRATGTVAVPSVVATSEQVLLLEALPAREDTDAAWETFARDLAALHTQTVHHRFGWDHDNWRGKIRQLNPWLDDGHEFFAQNRLLRYLEEPGAQTTLEPADRRSVENLCRRLPEIVPVMPPVLTHGDLWTENVLGSGTGSLALVDPSVSYAWGEIDIALLTFGRGSVPGVERFFAAYQEANPSPDGWEERLPILALMELLSWVAHVDLVPLPDPGPILGMIRDILRPFSTRPHPAP
jgi:fructosamine-3-kinase